MSRPLRVAVPTSPDVSVGFEPHILRALLTLQIKLGMLGVGEPTIARTQSRIDLPSNHCSNY